MMLSAAGRSCAGTALRRTALHRQVQLSGVAARGLAAQSVGTPVAKGNEGDTSLNIFKEGQEVVIGKDADYPDWLKVRARAFFWSCLAARSILTVQLLPPTHLRH
eukprot:SAG22_NODE_669_length_7994_cov_2.526536_2_plen_105_part_00